MKNTILIIIFLVCISAECCKEKERPTYYMPQEFNDYVVFPQGSYWLYEDSISGGVDSLNLLYFSIYIEENKNKDHKYEKMRQSFSSSKSSNFNTETLMPVGIYEYYGYGYYFDTQERTNAHSGEYYAKYDSLKVLDVWYKDVKCIKSYGIYELYDYWVKNIGIIKKENKTNNTIWKLKKHYINH
ncbi:MAG: hypothetical protein HY738_13110 [Bacteroidia bacterium]|nr:hypothetical protein [Bacteroidia bacterium]